MKFYYVNHKGEKIDFSDFPYRLQDGELLNWVYAYERSGSGFDIYRDSKEFPIDIAVVPNVLLPLNERQEQFADAVNHLLQVLEVDAIASKQGKLCSSDGSYLKCIFIASKKSSWNMGIGLMFNQFTLLSENPYWITETTKSFTSAGGSAGTGLDYPHDYPRDYSPKVLSDSVVNDNYSPVDFRMVIYGPAVNPEVTIGNNTYKVFTELVAGEYLVIDSQEHIVAQFDNLGGSTTKYNSRDKTCEIYEQIPSGVIPVLWSGGFGFDLTTYAKRSEPKWIL